MLAYLQPFCSTSYAAHLRGGSDCLFVASCDALATATLLSGFWALLSLCGSALL